MESENSMFLLHGIRGGSITYFDLKEKNLLPPSLYIIYIKIM